LRLLAKVFSNKGKDLVKLSGDFRLGESRFLKRPLDGAYQICEMNHCAEFAQ
jgi:hypothetical protein